MRALILAKFSINTPTYGLNQEALRLLTKTLTNKLKLNLKSMAIKVIAQLRELKIGKNPGKKFVMRPDLYSAIALTYPYGDLSSYRGTRK